MKRIKRLSLPLLWGVLALVSLVGPSSASPGAAPATVNGSTLSVPASGCYPAADSIDYSNLGRLMKSMAGLAVAICPVQFPEYGTYEIVGITMYAFDGDSGGDVCADATRTEPSSGSETSMGELCTSGVDPADPQAITISGAAISPNTVSREQGMYFWVTLEDAGDLWLYGLTVSYAVLAP